MGILPITLADVASDPLFRFFEHKVNPEILINNFSFQALSALSEVNYAFSHHQLILAHLLRSSAQQYFLAIINFLDNRVDWHEFFLLCLFRIQSPSLLSIFILNKSLSLLAVDILLHPHPLSFEGQRLLEVYRQCFLLLIVFVIHYFI